MAPGRIVLLVGPKGSGKTYLASRMEAELGFGFVRVEPIWLALAREIAPGSEEYDREGQALVIGAAREKLATHGAVVLESTGTAPWFERQRAGLAALGALEIVKVEAPPALCLERIHARDASKHIPVSDDRIAEINALAEKVDLPWSTVVRNTDATGADGFIETLRRRLELGA